MKFTFISIPAIALLNNLAAAWNVDSRCTKRRELEGFPFDPNEPDLTLIEDKKESFPLDPNGINLSTATFSTKNLRGSSAHAHRELESLTPFQLKMYWEEGYCWQEEWDERKWCLECEGSTCTEDDYLWLQECSSSSRQKFVYEPVPGSGGGKLKPYTQQDLCWTRTRINAHQLKPCGNVYKDGMGRDVQIFIGFTYDGSFELHPNGFDDESNPARFKCMCNHHHPKWNEIIRADDCSISRQAKTSRLVVMKGGNSNGTSGPSETGSYPELKQLGSEYCDEHTCGLCEGDCDSDDQCAGNLKCFQRGPNMAVPGCSGGSSLASNSDFCYDPDAEKSENHESGGSSGATKTLDSRGSEYCDNNKCGECMGDCDSDDQCEFGLVCFQRGPNQNVPGCIGQDSSGTDYCIKPN